MTTTNTSDLVQLILGEYSEPLTAQEIVAVLARLDITVSEAHVNKYLKELLDQGLIDARVETDGERFLRFGAQAKSRNARLFSISSPVPTRTKREVVLGHVVAPVRPTVQPRRTIEKQYNKAIASFARHGTFTVQMLTDKSGVNRNTVRVKLAADVESGLVVAVPTDSARYNRARATGKTGGGSRLYTIPSTAFDAVRDRANSGVKPVLKQQPVSAPVVRNDAADEIVGMFTALTKKIHAAGVEFGAAQERDRINQMIIQQLANI